MTTPGWMKTKNDSDLASDWGFSNRKAKEAANGMRDSQRQQSDEQRGVYDSMNQADDRHLKDYSSAAGRYQTNRDSYIKTYQGESRQIQQDANAMATDARKTYDTQILGRQKNIMDDAQKEAAGAMTLQEAGDVNNSVHRSVRALYDQQGQGVRQQGMADAGVLGALGMQNMAGQLAGAAPMTGGQMQAMMGQNMSQSGQAYARASQYANHLKEQGINRGFQESDKQYDRGQQAKDRYSGSIQDYERSYGNKQEYARQARNEDRAYISDKFGVEMGRQNDDFGIAQTQAGMRHGNSMNKGSRELQHINDHYGNEQGWYGAQAQAANADQARKLGFYQSYIQGGAAAAGAVAGGMMGGPGGAQAGAQVGSAAGGQAAGAVGAAAGPPAPVYGGGQQQGGVPGGGYASGNGYSYGQGYGGYQPTQQVAYSGGAYGNGQGPQSRRG